MSVTKARSAAERLQALGLELPILADNPYHVDHRAVGSIVHISGQLPFKDGELLGQGVVGPEVLGENGRHARTAIGVAGLPLNTPVEIQMVCTAP